MFVRCWTHISHRSPLRRLMKFHSIVDLSVYEHRINSKCMEKVSSRNQWLRFCSLIDDTFENLIPIFLESVRGCLQTLSDLTKINEAKMNCSRVSEKNIRIQNSALFSHRYLYLFRLELTFRKIKTTAHQKIHVYIFCTTKINERKEICLRYFPPTVGS